MTSEASKTNNVRGEDFAGRYFSGKVIDIGCGNDLVVPHAERFDKEEGDANNILGCREAESYDCVHSSHCLEHMRDVPAALGQWWGLVKPGGYLIVVVPDEDLYEQGAFPSLFNQDHKATFRIAKDHSWSPISYDLRELVGALSHSRLISIERHDAGYDYALKRERVGGWGRFLLRLSDYQRYLLRLLHFECAGIQRILDHLYFRLGAPLDQSRGDAMAQLQVVAQKIVPSQG
jgi:SAM-dependent methyltransferase